ncbi:MAG: bifunctional diaminohydroxyphosphoribosylaminopyrimidine deaminase/5-amino-6-(5-phosphoribosylamino)uracil reductase RibD [Candidatus Omnitrophota bacterium]
MDDSDIKYMRLALKLAEKANERTYPNPMVGAVLVKNGEIIGRGYHKKAGGDHAEIAAIKDAQVSCKGATMYVTLEPCDHYGRTPPCTKAIIENGITSVKIAMKDPNPINRGKGIRKLRKAGISVEEGICRAEAERISRKYIKYITLGLPYITVKLAQSIDGKIAARDGSSEWISSRVSREYVRKIRSGFNAIMVGANTAVNDDPFLLCAGSGKNKASRVVVDSSLRLTYGSNLMKTAGEAPLIIGVTEKADKAKIRRFKKSRGVVIIQKRSSKNRVPLKPFLRRLARMGIVNMLVEGGGELAGSLIDEKLADEVLFFIAPKILGGPYSSIKGNGVQEISKALRIRDMKIKMSGGDLMVSGVLEK